MCEALNLTEPEKLIKMAQKLGKTKNGRKVNTEIMNQFMQTDHIDRASTSDGISSTLEPE